NQAALLLCSMVLMHSNRAISACTGGGTTNITVVPTFGGSAFQVNALNPAGDITGFSYLPGDVVAHAFLFKAGVLSDLGTFGGDLSQGNAINASSQVAGWATTAAGDQHAFRYDGVLSNIVDAPSSSAVAINDAGQIAGNLVTVGGLVLGFVFSN